MRVLGLMSGTSVDAIDVAVCDIDATGGAAPPVIDVVAHREVPWVPEVRRRILALLPPNPTDIEEVCRLDQLIGQAFAEAARSTMAEVPGVEVVASHGQTVFHDVVDGRAHGTLQLGQPAWIAEATGVPVVSDLRAADIAAGGQGAPFVSILDALWFADRPTAVVNLGGIANVTIVRDGHCVVSGDTGPANCLMDAVVQRATGEACDRDGALAAAGQVDQALLERLLAHPWLALPMPRSTGREVFSLDWLDAQQASDLTLPDLVATLAEFTARTLLDQVDRHPVERIVVSGGGSHNPVLMRRLAASHEVATVDALGLPGDAKEAVLIALLGWLTVTGRPGVATDAHSRALTGARRPVVLGRVTPAQTLD